jgi:hypothetical protein
MIKQGVVITNETKCPITGLVCDCDNPNVECEKQKNKSVSMTKLSSMLSSESDKTEI